MENFGDFIKALNWETILAMIGIGWYFARDMRREIRGLAQEIQHQAKRTDNLYEIWCETQKEIKQQHIEFHKELKQLHIDFITKQRGDK